MRYLLDTNTVSDLIRNPHGRAAQRLRAVGEQQVFTSIIVAAESRFGAAKRGSRTLMEKVEAFLSKAKVLPLEVPFDRVYAEVRTELEAVGKPIGANDLLIASHALVLGFTLVTDNLREFARIDGLRVENWLR